MINWQNIKTYQYEINKLMSETIKAQMIYTVKRYQLECPDTIKLSFDGTVFMSFSIDYFLQYRDSFKTSYNLSQDEIDAIMKEIAQTSGKTYTSYSPQNINRYTTNESSPDSQTEFNLGISSPKSNTCSHEFVEYTGLVEKFNYCSICGIKE